MGFQIVLVTGDNHVAVPQNISAAVNSDCVNCLTYALATQLFVTLDGPLSEAGTQQIAALWQEIAAFGAHITEVPLSEIRSRLTAYEAQILAIIEKEQGPLAGAAHRRADRRTAHRRPEPQQHGHSVRPRVADRERPCGVDERRAGRRRRRRPLRYVDRADVPGPDRVVGPQHDAVGRPDLGHHARGRRTGRPDVDALATGQRVRTVVRFEVLERSPGAAKDTTL